MDLEPTPHMVVSLRGSLRESERARETEMPKAVRGGRAGEQKGSMSTNYDGFLRLLRQSTPK